MVYFSWYIEYEGDNRRSFYSARESGRQIKKDLLNYWKDFAIY